ncbi:2Fe-2S iron-sulfur cluster-binding protein [uncultured Thiodictyon sp.]|jgi:ferredoxin-NADP reductase|uniref:2Fe-2S iron-sulfur cluster-binding protein n=1 Tax=uncultured Thiodictyon sp. TaxID=1846217 RepID=UPI0025EA9E74|nr:2Fe-2S iron-sulfur cluster-binding protein [uncultured Thiodictyon sp.]
MSNATLALLITAAILAQVAVLGLLGWRRKRAQLRVLQRQAQDAAVGAAVLIGGPERDQGLDPAPLAQDIPAPAWPGHREFVVQRRVIEDGNGAVCSFYLAPADGQPLPTYRPGQYLTFKLEVPDPAGGPPKALVRCYSLSDRPRTDYYRVSIKRVPPPPGRPDLPPGVVSNHFHDQLKEGARVWARAPSGHFYVTQDSPLPVVLIGGGIGITPLLSILNTLSRRADPRQVWLFYGVRNGAEQIMREHLKTLSEGWPGLHLQCCYAAPDADDLLGRDYQHQGYVDLQLLQRTLGFGRHEFYVCGPPAMMESLVPTLEAQGVPTADIHYESFGPASLNKRPVPVPTTRAAAMAVRFSRSGKTVPWDGAAASLLELAEGQGITVDSGCRAGSCGTCETRIESGTVAYSQTPDADIQPGHCLLCIATPTADLTLAL